MVLLITIMSKNISVYYDPDCGFCRNVCFKIKKYLFLQGVEILPISSKNENVYNIFLNEYSWVVHEHETGIYYSKSRAWWRLVYASKFSVVSSVSYIPGVIWLGDKLYDCIARNRPKTCKI